MFLGIQSHSHRSSNSPLLLPVVARRTIDSALQHIHIFRPQSLPSLISTLETLPTYLLHTTHPSSNRPLGFIALDSASAFYWQSRAAEEDHAFQQTTTTAGSTLPPHPHPEPPKTYNHLTAALKTSSKTLNAPIIITSRSLHAPPSHHHPAPPRSLRPSLPTPLSTLPTARFILQRLPVRRFPASISVREALREAEDRQRAVDEGRFECVVNQWGMDPRTLERVRAGGVEGFGFRIAGNGLVMDEGWDTES